MIPDLLRQHHDLKARAPGVRIRDAAEQLGVSELELVVADPGTELLRTDVHALLSGLQTVGPAMALTRNAWCVHERRGVWTRPLIRDGVGLVVGADIDLRIFERHWVHVVHAVVENPRGDLESFQVFDGAGVAVHKVYTVAGTDRVAWDLVRRALLERAPSSVRVRQPDPARARANRVDREALLAAWGAMRDTHEAHGLLGKLDLDRTVALAAMEGDWTQRVDPAAATTAVLEQAAATALPIMVFVGNPGCIQIHTGPVRRVARRDRWLNVLDPDFDLHLNLDGLTDAWLVRKPTADGPVHSLELFGPDGSTVAQLFGARKPGTPEDPRWTALLEASKS